MHKVFCLLSGGVDSTTTLAIAREEFPDDEIECVTVNYGQRHLKEQECARYQVGAYGATHRVIDLRGLLSGMLVDKGVSNEAIPEVSYADLAPGISPTYVSFRNGMMLSALAAKAQSWIMEQEKLIDKQIWEHAGREAIHLPQATIYIGVHADDGVNWAYPDCTPEFIGAMANAIFVGTYHKVRVRAPLQYLDKPAVVREGLRLGVNYSQTWSCYKGEELHCGVCPTCRSRREAFDLNGTRDPTEYAQREAATA
jgi:7-cyano-7-deazaguanine synthase